MPKTIQPSSTESVFHQLYVGGEAAEKQAKIHMPKIKMVSH